MNIEIGPFALGAYARVFALWQPCDGVGLSEADSQEGIQDYLSHNCCAF